MNNVDFVVLFIAYCVLLVVSGFGRIILATLGRLSKPDRTTCPFKDPDGRCVQNLSKCYELSTHVVYRKEFPDD